MVAVVEAFGFRLSRVSGSHHIFVRDDVPELVNLQEVGGMAKPYQIRQFLKIVERYNLKIGAKREIESYRHIASELKLPPHEIVFVSDVTAELDAAADAGFETLLCVRPGNHSQPASAHVVIQSFDQIP